MKKYIIILLSALTIVSCTSDEKKKEQEQLFEEVMALHDEMMPLMGKIQKYRKQAEETSKTLFADSLKVNDEEAMELESLATELKGSYEAMMIWMRGFNDKYEGMSHDEIIDYLTDQKEQMEKVKNMMNGALEKADTKLAE